jgi:hypothetical protein
MVRMSGLVYNTFSTDPDTSWIFDSTSIETYGSSWDSFGYEIIFRPEEIRAPDSVIEELREAFMEPFGLPRRQYTFEPTFWRIYWDRGQLRASMIKRCEQTLDGVAKKHGIVIRLNGIIIQPRPMGYIQTYIELNKIE